MGRRYIISFESVSIGGAAQDLVQVIGASGKTVRLVRAWWGATDTTLPTAQMASTRIQFLGATVTNGSGGGTPAIKRVDPGDAAPSVTALSNNTTPASSSGTTNTLDESGDHIFNGYRSPPNWIDGKSGPSIQSGESLSLQLLSSLSGTVHLSGGCEVDESGA